MNAFKLDRRVRIERRTDTRNSTGEAVPAWSTVAEVWAQKKTLGGRELYAAQQVVPQASLAFRIRWRSDIVPIGSESMRVTDLRDNVVYGIQHIGEIGRRQGLELMVQSPPQ